MRSIMLCLALLFPCFENAAAETRTFIIDPGASTLRVHVGKTGIGSFAGHEHQIVARSVKGEVVADFADLSHASVDFIVDATTLAVIAEGEPEGDAPQVERAMKAASVLDTAKYPIIRFRSQRVTAVQLSPRTQDLAVLGELSLHGAVRPVVVLLQFEHADDALTGTGKVVVKQSDFGIEPTSAAGGLVRVEDEVTVAFNIVARAAR